MISVVNTFWIIQWIVGMPQWKQKYLNHLLFLVLCCISEVFSFSLGLITSSLGFKLVSSSGQRIIIPSTDRSNKDKNNFKNIPLFFFFFGQGYFLCFSFSSVSSQTCLQDSSSCTVEKLHRTKFLSQSLWAQSIAVDTCPPAMWLSFADTSTTSGFHSLQTLLSIGLGISGSLYVGHFFSHVAFLSLYLCILLINSLCIEVNWCLGSLRISGI